MRQMMQRMGGGGSGGRGGSSNNQAKGEPAKMSLGVDVTSNSLIVAAPEPMFNEVQSLVLALDQAGTQTQDSIEVRTLHLANPDVVNTALRAILGDSVSTSRSTGSGNSSSRSTPSSSNSPDIDAIRQRIEMFQRMQSGGQGGRGPSTGGAPGRPSGAPGGGRPGGGSGLGGRPGGGGTSGGRN